MTIDFEFSGRMNNDAINEADDIAWRADSMEDAWNKVEDAEYCDEIKENGTFTER